MTCVFLSAASLITVLTAAAGCKAANQQHSLGSRIFFFIKSHNTGSYFSAGSAWARLITSNTEYIGVNSTSPSTDNDKIRMIADNKVQAAFINGPEAGMAYHGDPVYWKQPQPLRALFALWPASYNLIAQKSSGIDKIGDIKGKSIAIFSAKSASGDMLEYFLGLYGITENNTQIYRVSENIGVMLFIRKEVDCIWYNMEYDELNTQYPSPANLQSIPADDLYKLIPVQPDSRLTEFLKAYPYFYLDDSRLMTAGFAACSAQMSEEAAYRMTKLWWENEDLIKQYVPDKLKLINRESNRNGIPVPFHPGALRYLREAGLIPENS